MDYTAKQLAKSNLSYQLEELLSLHSLYMEKREQVANKLLENSYPYDSFFNWLGEQEKINEQTLLGFLEEQDIEIRVPNKSVFYDLKESSM